MDQHPENPPPARLPLPTSDELPDEGEESICPTLTPSHLVGWWRWFDELMRGPSVIDELDPRPANGPLREPFFLASGRRRHSRVSRDRSSG